MKKHLEMNSIYKIFTMHGEVQGGQDQNDEAVGVDLMEDGWPGSAWGK